MSDQFRSSIHMLAQTANVVAIFAIATLAAALTIATALAAAGALPWLEFSAGFGGVTYENAGQIAQVGLTGLLLLLCVYLPSAQRVLRLENSHRRFSMGMHDVARAYAAAHASDRAGLFTMSSEYDAVRERIQHLRAHPDLESLEPEVLEVAAQMSQVSHDLASTYADDKVDRARAFLRQRQQEVDSFNDRLERAKTVTAELKKWANALDVEESVATSQLTRLRDSLDEILPELAPQEAPETGKKVVRIGKFAAE